MPVNTRDEARRQQLGTSAPAPAPTTAPAPLTTAGYQPISNQANWAARAPGAGTISPTLVQQLAGQTALPYAAQQFMPGASEILAAEQAGAQPTGPYQPLLNPLATQLYYQNTIGPLLAQIQGGRAQHIDNAFTNAMSMMQGWGLPDSIAGQYANALPQLQAGFQNLNADLATQAATKPSYDAMLNKLNSIQDMVLKSYFNSQAPAAGTSDVAGILQGLGLTPEGTKPAG